jgi:leucyl/phenylalanyl-tRNA--protein transferase
MSRFIDPEQVTNEHGVVHIGGKLTPDWLLDAYTHGIFPWPVTNPDNQKQSILAWFSPDPRCIFEFDRFYVSRRLERTCKSGRFRITFDTNFAGVIQACSEEHRENGIWITPRLIKACIRFHRLGYAHSVEAWCGGELAGGVYGVAVGGLFAAESMFFRHRNASKVALVALMRHLQDRGYQLVDIQMKTAHTARFGAVEIPRSEYLRRLQSALQHTPKLFGK